MTKIFIFAFLLFVATSSFSQVAMIKDKDGFTNVRSGPSNDSMVIHIVNNYELFFVLGSVSNNDWVKVKIPKNKFSLGCDGSEYIKGFIHSSRIKLVDELDKYAGDDFSFQYKLDTFSMEGKVIDYTDDKWITLINGRRYYGTDGDRPKIEIKSVDISYKGEKISVPEMLYTDLYECTNDFQMYKIKDYFIVQQSSNSDGAGWYMITWLIDPQGIKQRLIFIP